MFSVTSNFTFAPSKAFYILSASLLLTGCTALSVKSEFVDIKEQQAPYVAYHLPKSIVSLNVTRDADKKVTIGKLSEKRVADPRAQFRLNLLELPTANDQFVLTVGANGLLNSAKITNEDKTAEIISSATSLVTQVKDLIGVQSLDVEKKSVDPFSVDLVFDPDDPRQVAYAARQLNFASGGTFHLMLKTIEGDFLFQGNRPKPSRQSVSVHESVAVAKKCQGSFCFRTTRPIIVEIQANGATLVSRQTVEVVNTQQVSSFDVRRAACVKKVSDLTFENGVLTKADITKPSEILGCISIPATILKALVGFAS